MILGISIALRIYQCWSPDMGDSYHNIATNCRVKTAGATYRNKWFDSKYIKGSNNYYNIATNLRIFHIPGQMAYN